MRRILLTGSGGPFRTRAPDSLHSVTPDEACAHPTWSMGRKISVDSATMMNKGLEVIEACWLFDAAPESVEVVVHPQSVVHSMVEYEDGSVLAQLGNPDMRTPIGPRARMAPTALSPAWSRSIWYESRLSTFKPGLRSISVSPARLRGSRGGGAAPAALNAANEVAVEAFLNERLRFTGIARVAEATVTACVGGEPRTLDDVLELDRLARARAAEFVETMSC